MHFIEPKTVKPHGAWVLAEADPRAKVTRGGIILAEGITGIEKVSVEMATVLGVGGWVAKELGIELKVGERFCFRGFLKDATIYDFEKSEAGGVVFLIHARDLLAIVDDDTKVGVFI